jgi:hypothetical protein
MDSILKTLIECSLFNDMDMTFRCNLFLLLCV